MPQIARVWRENGERLIRESIIRTLAKLPLIAISIGRFNPSTITASAGEFITSQLQSRQ